MSGGYAVEPADLDAAAATLHTTQSALEDQSKALAVTPDAGRSSQEVAGTFGLLGTGMSALAQRIGTMADGLTQSATDYRAADWRTSTTFEQFGTPAFDPGATSGSAGPTP